MLPELNLQGRTAMVTGAGRGIGREIALVLAEAGADIVVTARTESEIEALAADIRELGRETIAIPADVAKSSDVDTMVEQALMRFEKIDILVNNAGIAMKMPVAPLPDMTLKPPQVLRASSSRTSDEEWQSIIDTNLSGPFYCCRAVAPHMMDRRYGKIINISSSNATQAFPYVAAYNASKAGVNMLTRVLALAGCGRIGSDSANG